ncbi:unnamed protein product [Strongylus vulgaris]|uniref:Uncharacterized protein n=1 Tax=Strongylus vulgaris TaxID=40348 RepID=A0A3P7JW29_STRVU|nr:unnamed protein product [Strongylus vulgaris]
MKRTDRRDSRKKLARSKSAARPRPPGAGRDVSRRPYEITVIVLGATRVGKSALVSQFLWEGFLSEYRPTVEEFNWVEYDLGEGSALMLQVIDSSGSRDFLAMRHFYIRTGDAFLVRIICN